MPDLPAFKPLTGLFEPSAIQQLPDGRFLVVEDEKSHPFSLVTITADGRVTSAPLLPPEQEDDAVWKLEDLEALAIDPSGWIYALTSHSRSGSGSVKKARDKLVRFRVEGGRMTSPSLMRELKPALVEAYPLLAAAADVTEVKPQGGLNIEALESGADGRQLLVGFRSPLLEGRAVIACVENPAAIFDAGEPPRMASRLITLDLGGNGIRGMAWIPDLGGHLIISGPVAKQSLPFQLWFWSGRQEQAPRRVRVGDRLGFQRAEGVAPALIDGQPHIVIVSDDGKRGEGRSAHFLLVEPSQLVIGD